jgi:hypothetical protein
MLIRVFRDANSMLGAPNYEEAFPRDCSLSYVVTFLSLELRRVRIWYSDGCFYFRLLQLYQKRVWP